MQLVLFVQLGFLTFLISCFSVCSATVKSGFLLIEFFQQLLLTRFYNILRSESVFTF